MSITHTFSALRAGDKVTYTVDVQEEEWLQAGETVDTGLSVFSTAETGIAVGAQNWVGGTKNTVLLTAITGRTQPYLMLMRLKTNLRDQNKEIYIPVRTAATVG